MTKETEKKELLTLGHASCHVLGVKVTLENRKLSKEYFVTTRLTVTYINGRDPMEPVALGEEVVDLNNMKYRSYPNTRESTPVDEEEVSPNDTSMRGSHSDTTNTSQANTTSTTNTSQANTTSRLML